MADKAYGPPATVPVIVNKEISVVVMGTAGVVVNNVISGPPVYLRIAVIDAVTSDDVLLAYKYVVSGPFAISVNPTTADSSSLRNTCSTIPSREI